MPLKSYSEYLSEQTNTEPVELTEQVIKKVPMNKGEAMWDFLRTHFDLGPSKMTASIITNKVDGNETIAQITHGKNGGIGFVQVDQKIGFAEYVGENVGISNQRMTVDQFTKLLKGL